MADHTIIVSVLFGLVTLKFTTANSWLMACVICVIGIVAILIIRECSRKRNRGERKKEGKNESHQGRWVFKITMNSLFMLY